MTTRLPVWIDGGTIGDNRKEAQDVNWWERFKIWQRAQTLMNYSECEESSAY